MMRRTATALGAAAWMLMAAPAGAATPAEPASAASAAARPVPNKEASETLREELALAMKRYVEPHFAVYPDDELDPELRAAALSMQAEHVPRVAALLQVWLDEELKQEMPRLAWNQVLARLANEFAIWGRDTTGPAYDDAIAQALRISGICRPTSDKVSEWVLRVSRLRGLPAAQRSAALAAERQLLARWGQPRQVSEAEPLPAEEMLLQWRTTGIVPAKPVPPTLAYFLFVEDDAERFDPWTAHATHRCAMHQWAGANPAQFRAAMSLQAPDVFRGSRRPPIDVENGGIGYPYWAAAFNATGLVVLQGQADAAGKARRIAIVRRDIKVPGLRGVRPFAFEHVLDAPSLERARRLTTWEKRTGDTLEHEYDWRLK